MSSICDIIVPATPLFSCTSIQKAKQMQSLLLQARMIQHRQGYMPKKEELVFVHEYMAMSCECMISSCFLSRDLFLCNTQAVGIPIFE